MAAHQNRLSRFWQELKRRRVIHVITVYASAAFVIIELINNLSEPLNLPGALSTIVIIILAAGFPLAIILSWLYDLTAGTFERTKPIEYLPEKETVQVPNAWKIATYISFIVIAGLIVLNIAGRSELIKPGMIQAVAVLPFNNYTGDDNLDYVAEGMHSSLITDIGKVSALRVTGETTSKTYKNTDKSAPQIGEELNVDLLIEPTLTCWGENVCVLIRAVTTTKEEKQVLVREYRVDREEILSFYGRVTKEISQEIKVELSPEEMRLLSKSRKVDREAYEEYLKARSYVNEFSKEALYQAIDYLHSAIEKEPDWAPLYAGLAELWMWIQQAGYEPPSIAGPKIFENLNRAMELDPDLAVVHYLSAMIAQWGEWNWEKSEKAFLKALAINPSDSWTRLFYAQLLLILQRNDEAKAQIELAAGLDPLSDDMKLLYSGTLVQAGDFEAALPVAEELVAKNPTNPNANHMIESAAYHLGEYDKVIRAVQYALPFSIGEGVYAGIVRMYNESGIVAAYVELMKHMEKHAENNPISFLDMSSRYIIANQPDKAMDWIETGFEQHDPQLGYIVASGRHSEPLYGNPRFIAICEKANLPLPVTNR
jgi:TolB-like protein